MLKYIKKKKKSLPFCCDWVWKMQVHVGSHLIGLFSSPLTWAVISLKLEVEGSLSFFFCLETVFRVLAKKKKRKLSWQSGEHGYRPFCSQQMRRKPCPLLMGTVREATASHLDLEQYAFLTCAVSQDRRTKRWQCSVTT